MIQVERLTVAQCIVKYLQSQMSEFDGKVERVIGALWGIWGHGNVAGIGQAMDEFGEALPFYQAKNEQSMVHAAIGYAKAKNRRATLACSASIGPGSTNMLTGAATATVNRIPVLLLASDTFASRRPGNTLQQLEHPIDADLSVNDAFRPLSRFYDRIERPEQLFTALPRAMQVLLDPADTGAVTLSLPQDIQGEAFDVPHRFLEKKTWSIRRRPPARADITDAVRLIMSAKRPLLIAGGGVRYSAAEQAVVTFAEAFGIPIGETHAGKGVARGASLLLGGHGLSGTGAAEKVAAEADLVIAIGTRLSDFTTASRSAFAHPDVQIIGVNVNASDAYKAGGLPVVADAKLAVEELFEALTETGWKTDQGYRDAVKAAIAAWRETYAADVLHRQGQLMSQGTILGTVNETAMAGDIVIAAAGTPPGETKKGWDNVKGEEVFLEFGFSCMGHEIPAGLGVRLARPEAGEIFILIGDGTYLMNPTELVTAVQEGLKVTVVLIDNSGFQCIRELQQNTTGTENFGNEFRKRRAGDRQPNGDYLPLDLVANAASMGCQTFSADDPEALKTAIAEARRSENPVVIVCKADKRASSVGNDSWWDLGVAQVSTLDRTRAAYASFRVGQKTQRVLT